MVIRMDPYQKRIWRQNQNRIIKLLSKKPLTFKEIIEKSTLSRSVVNSHLNKLQEKGLIKKTYEDGKILNVLQPSEIRLVDFFLNQLESIGLPSEVLKKGKSLLTDEALVYSGLAYNVIFTGISKVHENWFTVFRKKRALRKPKITMLNSIDVFGSDPFPSKVPHLLLEGVDSEERKIDVLIDINPYSFHIVLTYYQIEKLVRDQRPKVFAKTKRIIPSIILGIEKTDKQVKKTLDEALEWWFGEVCEYLPSSKFFETLMALYFDTVHLPLELSTKKQIQD